MLGENEVEVKPPSAGEHRISRRSNLIMLKIIHTSDLHIGAKFGTFGEKAEAQRKAILNALAKIVDIAIERSAHIVLISGDLFDSNFPSRASVDFVKSQFNRLNEAKIHAAILPGTHDCLSQDSIYKRERFGSEMPFVFVFDDASVMQKEFTDINLTLFAKPNTTNKSTESPTAFLESVVKSASTKYKVAMAHGSVQIESKAAADDMPITLREISSSGVQYLAFGHWHGCQEFSFGSTIAWYAGSPEITYQEGKGGLGQGYAVLVEIDDGAVEAEPVRVSEKELREIDIDMQIYENMDNVYHEIEKSAGHNVILRANIFGFSDATSLIDAEKMEEDFRDKFFSISVKDNTTLKIGEITGQNYPEELVIGQFVRIMRAKIDGETDADQRRILEEALQIGVAELEGKGVLEN